MGVQTTKTALVTTVDPLIHCQAWTVVAAVAVAETLPINVSHLWGREQVLFARCYKHPGGGRPRSSTVPVCIDWLHPAARSEYISRTAAFYFQWATGMEWFATSSVRQQSVTEHVQTDNEEAQAT